MEKTIAVINRMQKEGIVETYAIGGAIAAAIYVESIFTYDIDIFIPFKETPGSLIISPAPIYQYLARHGYKPKDEHVFIEGWLVQFLPADEKLYREALSEAVETMIEKTIRARVMRPEHLVAIALKTGRAKDFERIRQFVEFKAFDQKRLDAVLKRNGLVEKWNKFKKEKLSHG